MDFYKGAALSVSQSHRETVDLLTAQIEDLRKLVFPTQRQEETAEAREVDAVLSASEKAPEMSEAEISAILDGQREMDLLVSGNYDTDLLSK